MAKKQIRIGENEYEIETISLSKIKQFDYHIKEKLKKEYLEDAKDAEAPPATVMQGLREIRQRSCYDEIQSPYGMCYLLWLALKKGQKDMTVEQAGELLDSNNLIDIMFQLDLIDEEEMKKEPKAEDNDSTENPFPEQPQTEGQV